MTLKKYRIFKVIYYLPAVAHETVNSNSLKNHCIFKLQKIHKQWPAVKFLISFENRTCLKTI